MITAATAMITVVGEFCDEIGHFCDGLGGFCGGMLTVVSKWRMLLQIVYIFRICANTLCTSQIVHP